MPTLTDLSAAPNVRCRFLRIEPIGWGDVHWQLGDTSQTRFTNIEVAP